MSDKGLHNLQSGIHLLFNLVNFCYFALDFIKSVCFAHFSKGHDVSLHHGYLRPKHVHLLRPDLRAVAHLRLLELLIHQLHLLFNEFYLLYLPHDSG